MAYTKNTPPVDNGTGTQLEGRDILSVIKDNTPGDCALTKLIKSSSRDNKTGKVTHGNGLIESKVSKTSRVELFTHTPKGVTQEADTGSALLDVEMANAETQITTRMVFQNTTNLTVGYVDKISGTTITMISLGATFSSEPGDTLLYLGTMYEPGSSDPGYVWNSDDNHYNHMGIFRNPLEITLNAKDTEQEAGGNIYDRYLDYEWTHAVRAVERNMIFGRRAASGNYTTASTLGVNVASARGLWDMAKKSYPFNGSITIDKIMSELPLAMDRSVDVSKQLMWLMGNEARGNILKLMQNNALVIRRDEGNKYKKWGITADIIITNGVELAIVKHDAFNWGANTSRGIIIDPEQLVYRFKNGSPPMGKSKKGAMGGNNRNWNIIRNIESNSSDTQKDDVFVECCLQSRGGAYEITTTTQMI